jgi:preprotein translocase subunit SecF
MDDSPNAPKISRWKDELQLLRQRSTLVNWCIALLILCAILIGSTIVLLFFGETLEVNFARAATVAFMAGVVSFLLALLCFFAETLLSAKILKLPS